jgi:hypothetical protein
LVPQGASDCGGAASFGTAAAPAFVGAFARLRVGFGRQLSGQIFVSSHASSINNSMAATKVINPWNS